MNFSSFGVSHTLKGHDGLDRYCVDGGDTRIEIEANMASEIYGLEEWGEVGY